MIGYLLKKWWLFLIVGFCAGLFGLISARMQKPFYESRLTFALDQGEGGVSGAFSLAAQFGLNIGGGKDIFSGDNIIEILKSRRIIEKVLLSTDTIDNKATTLIEYYLELTNKRNTRTSDIHFLPSESREGFSYLKDSLLFSVYSTMVASEISAQRPDRKLSIYEVKVTSEDERFAKLFTDRLVAETNNFYIDICSKKSRETLEILQNRVASMKGNLDTSLSTRASAQDINLNPAFAAAQVPILKQQTNIQVYSAAYGEMFKNLELARYNYLKQIPLMQIIDPADYPMKKIKKSGLKTGVLYASVAGFLLLLIILVMKTSFIKTENNTEITEAD
jgi:uncharacterized protein involved in exopolysaccharide biosynthesis